MNISSIVVKTKKEHIESVVNAVRNSNFCEYHLNDEKGRIIVTVEGKGVEEEINKLKQIQQLPHVISAEMMYAYSEDELNTERDKLERTDNIPEWLNDENVKAEDIKYKGDLKKRF